MLIVNLNDSKQWYMQNKKGQHCIRKRLTANKRAQLQLQKMTK